MLEGMIEGKIPPGRPRNTFIGQIKKDAEVKSYRAFTEIASERQEWRRRFANQPTTG